MKMEIKYLKFMLYRTGLVHNSAPTINIPPMDNTLVGLAQCIKCSLYIPTAGNI